MRSMTSSLKLLSVLPITEDGEGKESKLTKVLSEAKKSFGVQRARSGSLFTEPDTGKSSQTKKFKKKKDKS